MRSNRLAFAPTAIGLALAFASCATHSQRPRRASADGVHPRGTFYAALTPPALGSLTNETHPSDGSPGLDDDTEAGMFRLSFEAGGERFAGGVQFEFTVSDDDLHGVGAEATTLDLFPHFTVRPELGPRFRLPIRVGPMLQVSTLEIPANGGSPATDLAYVGVGIALEVEPEVELVRKDDRALSLYGAVRGGVGDAVVQLEAGSVDETFDTEMSSVGLEIGLRAWLGKLLLTAGYLSRHAVYDESDPEFVSGGSLVVYEADFAFEGLFFGGGVRW